MCLCDRVKTRFRVDIVWLEGGDALIVCVVTFSLCHCNRCFVVQGGIMHLMRWLLSVA